MVEQQSFTEILCGKVSIYALNEITKEWKERGSSGQFRMLQNPAHKQDVRIHWSRPNKSDIWWRLLNGTLKPKRERAWVLKAWNDSLGLEEIIAMRFADVILAQYFADAYNGVYPPHLQELTFSQHAPNNSNNKNASRSQGPWQCSVCTFENTAGTLACSMCGLAVETSPHKSKKHKKHKKKSKHKHKQSMEVSEASQLEGAPNREWSCPSCTFVNQASVLQCKICAAVQPANTSSDAHANMNGGHPPPSMNGGAAASVAATSTNAQWICSICTLQNAATSTRCRACGTPHSTSAAGVDLGPGAPGHVADALSPSKSVSLSSAASSPNMYPFSPSLPSVSAAAGFAQASSLPSSLSSSMQQPAAVLSPVPTIVGAQHNYLSPHAQSANVIDQIMRFTEQQEQEQELQMRNRNRTLTTYKQQHEGKFAASKQEFEKAASDIAVYNDDPASIYATLRSVSKKLLKDDIRFRTLETTNAKVTERLLGFEGVLDFLMLLEFESDEMGMKLVCEQKPSVAFVKMVVSVLKNYEQRMGVGRKKKNKKLQAANGDGMPAISEQNENEDQNVQKNEEDNDEEDNDALHKPSQTKNGTTPQDDDGQDKNKDTDIGATDDGDLDEKQQAQIDAMQKEDDTLTLEQIIIWSTHESVRDHDSMETLIITHKTISDSPTLLRQLRHRFNVPIPDDIGDDADKLLQFKQIMQKPIQLKVMNALRKWMQLYWDEDFSTVWCELGDEMQQELMLWIQELYDTVEQDPDSKWVKPLTDTIQKEAERYRVRDADHGKGKGNIDADQGKGNNMNNGENSRIRMNIDEECGDNLIAYILPVMRDTRIEIPSNKQQCQALIAMDNAEQMADQITLLDYEIFCNIEARECIGQAWKKKNNKKLAPHILGIIQQFNSLTVFVEIMILRERSLRQRSKALLSVIKMGERFRVLRNYNSLCAIYSALNSAPIHRLKLAWKRVPEKYKNMYENFRVIFSRDFNHRNLRHLFRWAPAPSIPHIGLFLQDLVFIDDGNSTKIEIENLKQHGAMANFSKCVRIADRLKHIRLYQSHPYNGAQGIQNDVVVVKEDSLLQRMILLEFERLLSITEDQIWDMSSEVKKMDERQAKKGMF